MNFLNDLGCSPLQKSVVRWAVVTATVVSPVGIGLAIAETAPYVKMGALAIPQVISTSWIGSGQVVSSSQLATDLSSLQAQITALTPKALIAPTVSVAVTAGGAAGTGGFAAGGGVYTTPAGVLWLDVEMVGGGGGGGNIGTAVDQYSPTGPAHAGNQTYFGGGALAANGGSPGCPALATPAACGEGGTASATASSTYATLATSTGGGGAYAASFAATTGQNGGAGGASVYGGPGPLIGGTALYNGAVGSGGNGGTGEACSSGVYAGSGGGAGGYVRALVYPSAGETFSYSVGSGGGGGYTTSNIGSICGSGNYNGLPGMGGAIYVTEHYQ